LTETQYDINTRK